MNKQAPQSANEIVTALGLKLTDVDSLLYAAKEILAGAYFGKTPITREIEKVRGAVDHAQNLLIIAKERSAEAVRLSDEAELATLLSRSGQRGGIA